MPLTQNNSHKCAPLIQEYKVPSTDIIWQEFNTPVSAEGDKMSPCVNFVTGNANKLREVKAILEPGIEVRSNPLDIEEAQGTIEEVTESKCRRAAEIVNGPVLVEDTALCFNALAGLPGPYM